MSVNSTRPCPRGSFTARFSTSDRMDEMNFGSPKVLFPVWGSPIWVYWYLVGRDPKRHTFGVYAFHRYHLFLIRRFLQAVGYGQDIRKPPFFGSGWLAPLLHFRDVSQLAAGSLPHIYVFSIEIMKIVVFFCGAF